MELQPTFSFVSGQLRPLAPQFWGEPEKNKNFRETSLERL
jgi:hypothetical protein